MWQMFYNAHTFDQPLNSWNVSNVTNMNGMFATAKNFDQPLNSWDVSNVTNINGMFAFTENFNQDISDRDVSSVNNMGNIFQNAIGFNTSLSGWADKLSNVTIMDYMFHRATSYNQDLSSRCLSNVSHSNFNTDAPFASNPNWQPNRSGECEEFPQLELI